MPLTAISADSHVGKGQDLTACDYYQETQGKDAGNTNLVLEFHLKPRHHGNGKSNDDDVGEYVDYDANHQPCHTKKKQESWEAGIVMTYRK